MSKNSQNNNQEIVESLNTNPFFRECKFCKNDGWFYVSTLLTYKKKVLKTIAEIFKVEKYSKKKTKTEYAILIIYSTPLWVNQKILEFYEKSGKITSGGFKNYLKDVISAQ